MAARNWLETLWPASYKGVPFQVEKDDLDGGRRIKSHEFPGRDDPLHEDLGSAVARWEVTAYVASDAADGEAAALVAVLDTAEAGPLVLPIDGPVLARAHKWRRVRERDKAGYIALSITFLREGAAVAGVSLASLAQSVFDAVDGLAGVLDTLLGSAITAATVDWVSEALDSTVVDMLAGLDVVADAVLDDQSVLRATTTSLSALVAAVEDGLSPSLSASLAAGLKALGLAPPAVTDGLAAVALVVARAVADATIAADAVDGPGRVVEAFSSWLDFDPSLAPAAAATPSRLLVARNAVIGDIVSRLVALGVTAEALVRTDFASRAEGVAARAAFVAASDRVLSAVSSLGAADAAPPAAAIVSLRTVTVDWLTRSIADLSPVRTVQLAAELPSVVVAWMLWSDPARSGELVARNHVSHPGFMPRTFEALVE